MELLQPVMEPQPTTEMMDGGQVLVAEARAFEEKLEEIRLLASTELGKQAMIQAGMPEIFISDNELQGQAPLGFVETSIARIALGGL